MDDTAFGSSPRMWGTLLFCRTKPARVGSSPRMWGIFRPSLPRAPLKRFIPTHVGNSDYASGAAIAPAVHPHACGELKVSTKRIPGIDRFIPTHVGNSSCSGCDNLRVRFIPTHVGNSQMFVGTNWGYGSSPRMWGTHCTPYQNWYAYRFIPTHVGSPVQRGINSKRGSVHPHACGELFNFI